MLAEQTSGGERRSGVQLDVDDDAVCLRFARRWRVLTHSTAYLNLCLPPGDEGVCEAPATTLAWEEGAG